MLSMHEMGINSGRPERPWVDKIQPDRLICRLPHGSSGGTLNSIGAQQMTFDHELKMTMIETAREKFGHITPTIRRKSLLDCFTRYENRVYLWFNTPDCSTHAIHVELEEAVNV